MAVNGEATTTDRKSSAILQGIDSGTLIQLEFTSEPSAAGGGGGSRRRSTRNSARMSISSSLPLGNIGAGFAKKCGGPGPGLGLGSGSGSGSGLGYRRGGSGQRARQ